MATVLWEMKQPSSGLVREPKLDNLGSRSICLWWVAEAAETPRQVEALVFSGVEAYKCSYFLTYSVGLIEATYDTLVDLGRTLWLTEVTSTLNGHASTADLRHLAISFDDGPLYEFIARAFEYRVPFDARVIESNIRQRRFDAAVIDRSLALLQSLRDILKTVEDKHWLDGVENLIRDCERLQIGDCTPMDIRRYFDKLVRSISGGMGSLSDLNLSSQAGHSGDAAMLRAANMRKGAILDELFGLAKAELAAFSDSA